MILQPEVDLTYTRQMGKVKTRTFKQKRTSHGRMRLESARLEILLLLDSTAVVVRIHRKNSRHLLVEARSFGSDVTLLPLYAF